MNTLTLTKSDFKKYNLNNLQLHALVMGFAEFNFYETIRLNLTNPGAQYRKECLVEDMVDFMKDYEDDYGAMETEYDSEFFSERLVKMLEKKEEKRVQYEAAFDDMFGFNRFMRAEAENE